MDFRQNNSVTQISAISCCSNIRQIIYSVTNILSESMGKIKNEKNEFFDMKALCKLIDFPVLQNRGRK